MAEDFKKYDSQAMFIMQNARLAKPPQIIEGGEKPMVKLTFVLTSRSDRHADTWVEVTVQDRQSDLAAALEKNDVLGFAGFPATRVWGDPEKTSFEVVRAELFPSIELIMKAKERGWTPGGGVKASGTGNGKGKTTAKKPAGKKAKPVQDLDDDLPADEG